MKTKRKIKPPKYESLSIDKRGKPVFPVFTSSSGTFMPMQLHSPRMTVVEDRGFLNWNILEHRRTREIYKHDPGFFAKYGTFIMSATLAGLIAFMVFFMVTKFEIMTETIASASSVLANAAERIAGGGTQVLG
jgi:hypothetical protein